MNGLLCVWCAALHESVIRHAWKLKGFQFCNDCFEELDAMARELERVR